jgi:hypothetical protein
MPLAGRRSSQVAVWKVDNFCIVETQPKTETPHSFRILKISSLSCNLLYKNKQTVNIGFRLNEPLVEFAVAARTTCSIFAGQARVYNYFYVNIEIDKSFWL